MIPRLFWAIYPWLWWRIPGNKTRYHLMLLDALRTNHFSRGLKAISDRQWLERIEREGKI